MDASSLVDMVLEDHEHLDPEDTDNEQHRRRTLRNAQKVATKVWTALGRSPLTKGSADVVITAGIGVGGGDGNLPANFQAFGLEVRKIPIKDQLGSVLRRPLHVFLEARAAKQQQALPLICAVTSQSALGVQVISVYPYPTAAVTLVVPYDKKPPVLLDGVEPGVASGLEQFPEQYHTTVLYEGTVMWNMRDKGDIRAETSQKARFEELLKEMVEAESPSRGMELRMPVHGSVTGMYGIR